MIRIIGLAFSTILLAIISSPSKITTLPPSIVSIAPNSGYIGSTLTLAGNNLSFEKNTVYAGSKQPIWSGPSIDGRTLVFDVLNAIQSSCYPGSRCRIWVEHEGGKSNAIDFSLTDWIIPEVQVNIIPPATTVFRKGEENIISWTGGHRVVALGLAKADATTDFDISSSGMIVGWINTKVGQGYHLPNSSFAWDAKQVCDMNLSSGPETNCHYVNPGDYKLLILSEDPTGSMWIATGHGKLGKYSNQIFKGNWNLSPTITISR